MVNATPASPLISVAASRCDISTTLRCTSALPKPS